MIIKIVSTSDIFKIIHFLYYHATVNFNQTCVVFNNVKWFRHNLITCVSLFFKEIALKMATWLAETCWWPKYNTNTYIKLKCICWPLIQLMHLIYAMNMAYINFSPVTFRLSPFTWDKFCNHLNLVCFPLSTNFVLRHVKT